MYNCIKSLISGDIKDTIFTQFENLPDQDDVLSLFKKLTTFTAVSSLQRSILSFNNIMNFNPINYCFNIPSINRKLVHRFVLATTATRRLIESKRIQHTLTVYGKILQPEVWAQWVRAQVDSFEEVKIVKCQDFMNSAVVKYNNIIGTSGKFKGSVTSAHEDIVAMVSTSTRKKTREPKTILPSHSEIVSVLVIFHHFSHILKTLTEPSINLVTTKSTNVKRYIFATALFIVIVSNGMFILQRRAACAFSG